MKARIIGTVLLAVVLGALYVLTVEPEKAPDAYQMQPGDSSLKDLKIN